MAIINLVDWKPEGEAVYAWKYPHNNLSTYTQLLVAESQEALLFSSQKLIEKFGPGRHTLSTENIPILRSLFGIPFGGKNPFTAEIWFVNKLEPLNINWATDAMKIHDVDYNTMLPMRAVGRYGLKVKDAERFLFKWVGTAKSFSSRDLTDQFYGPLCSKTKSVIMRYMAANNIGIKSVSMWLDGISNELHEAMIPFWTDYGLTLSSFYITSIEVDPTTEAGRKIEEAMSRQSAQAITGSTWQQSQAFEIAKDAVSGMGNSQGGLLGAIMATNMMGSMGGMGGGIMQPQYQQPTFGGNQSQNPPTGTIQPQPVLKEVFCSSCSKKFPTNMKFCPHCGDPYHPCPRCATDNDSHAKRCVSCGTNLSSEASLACSNCSALLPRGGAFCPNCGKPVSEGSCSRCGSTLNNATFCPSCGHKNK